MPEWKDAESGNYTQKPSIIFMEKTNLSGVT